jgi:hypothetical protein
MPAKSAPSDATSTSVPIAAAGGLATSRTSLCWRDQPPAHLPFIAAGELEGRTRELARQAVTGQLLVSRYRDDDQEISSQWLVILKHLLSYDLDTHP